jgi:hypothetical protein
MKGSRNLMLYSTTQEIIGPDPTQTAITFVEVTVTEVAVPNRTQLRVPVRALLCGVAAT